MSSNAGLVSLAHLRIDCTNLTNPVSLGFSRPLSKRFFITAMNSLLLSWPSSKTRRLKANKFKIDTLPPVTLTVFIKNCKDHMYYVIAEIDVGNRLSYMFKGLLINRGTSNVVES